MLKIVYRTLVILLVAGLLGGGLYLLVEKGGVSVLGTAIAGKGPEGMPGDGGMMHGREGRQPPGGQGNAGFTQPAGRDGFLEGSHGREGEMQGFSWSGLSGVLVQAGKVAAITLAVVLVQAVARLFKRRKTTPVPAPSA